MTEIRKNIISVITVCYNAKSNLEKTILSVLNQTYSNIEYIIIDGGSTDGTIDIIKRYDDKITYWQSEPDNGIYDAMNKGIQKANGEWINFMNAGDLFASTMILQQMLDAIKPGVRILRGNIIRIYPKFRVLLHRIRVLWICLIIPFIIRPVSYKLPYLESLAYIQLIIDYVRIGSSFLTVLYFII